MTARHVIVATNGYTPEDVSLRLAGRLMPALSSIIVTRPLSEEERQAQGWTSQLLAYDLRNRRITSGFRPMAASCSAAGVAPMPPMLEPGLCVRG